MPLNLNYTHLEARACPECGQTSLASPSSSASGEHAASGTPLYLADYLRSYGISDTDTEEINGVLPMLENDAAIYDEQIHRLKGVLRELRSRRDTTKVSIKQLRSLLAPVRRLPREILDIVCWHSLPNLWDEEGIGYCQLAFSQVCHTWREVALACHPIWARLSLGDYSSKRESWTRPVWEDMLGTYIHRSGSYPLSIDVHPHSGWPSSTSEDVLWEYVAKEVHRVSSICLRLSHTRPIRLPQVLPALKRLELGTGSYVDMPATAPYISLQLQSVSHTLRTLKLFQIHTRWLNIDWSTLRELSFTSPWPPSNEETLTALRQCTCLEALEITMFGLEEGIMDTQPDIVLPRLRRLKIYDETMRLVPLLQLPALQVLHADMQRRYQNIIPHSLVRHGRSLAALRTLTVQDLFCSSFPSLLDFPGVRRLRLLQIGNEGPMHRPLVRAIEIATGGSIVPLPGLTHLEVDGRNWDGSRWCREDEEAIEKAVESRIGFPEAGDLENIQRLTIKVPDAMFSEVFLAWLEGLEGRSVVVEYIDSQVNHRIDQQRRSWIHDPEDMEDFIV
ncbi:hypothetical protein EV714DRAFT_217428 [Schizophyllum commune]